MPWTLADLSKVETDTLRKSVLDKLLMEASVLELVPWETIGALNTTVVRYKDLPSVGFRKVNEGYSESTGRLEQLVENISLLGGMIDTDKAIARAKNSIADTRAINQALMLKALAYKFNDYWINGDHVSDPESFSGLKSRVDALNSDGYTSQYIDNDGTQGDGILLSDAESHNFLDHLDELMYSIRGHNPDVCFLNKKCLLATRSILRRQRLLDVTRDMFDRQVDVYQNARFIDIGVKADQSTQIITNTETLEDDGGAESTSIYAAKMGIGEYLWGIQEYPLEVEDKGLLEAKPVYRTEVDWPLGLVSVDPYCIARLYAIIPDDST